MYAEEILQLDLQKTSVRRRLEMYGYGTRMARQGFINFDMLKSVAEDMGNDPEEIDLLTSEFVKGYLDGSR